MRTRSCLCDTGETIELSISWKRLLMKDRILEMFMVCVVWYVSGFIFMEKVSIVDLNLWLYRDASLLIKREEVLTGGVRVSPR